MQHHLEKKKITQKIVICNRKIELKSEGAQERGLKKDQEVKS
jgi:hypothetical protein